MWVLGAGPASAVAADLHGPLLDAPHLSRCAIAAWQQQRLP